MISYNRLNLPIQSRSLTRTYAIVFLLLNLSKVSGGECFKDNTLAFDLRFTLCISVDNDGEFYEDDVFTGFFRLQNYGTTTFNGTIRAFASSSFSFTNEQLFESYNVSIGPNSAETYHIADQVDLEPGEYRLFISYEASDGTEGFPDAQNCTPTTGNEDAHYQLFTINENTCSHGRTLTFSSPSPGDLIEAGEPFSFTWDSEQLGPDCRVSIIYRVDGGEPENVPGLPFFGALDDGEFEVTFPTSIDSDDVDFVIGYVKADNEGNPVGDGVNNCTIQSFPCSEGAFINVNSPQTGFLLTAGAPWEITWTGATQGNDCPVTIGYEVDEGEEIILENSYPDNGNYTWNIDPTINSDNVDIIVAYVEPDLDDDIIFGGVSNFRIHVPIQVPSLNSPENLEEFSAGTTSITFDWQKNNYDEVAEYYLHK